MKHFEEKTTKIKDTDKSAKESGENTMEKLQTQHKESYIMNRAGKLIYTTKFDYKVHVVTIRDIRSERVSIDVYIVRPDNTMTVPVTIARKDVYSKKKWFEFLLDYECGIGRDESLEIANKIYCMLKDKTSMDVTQTGATMEELHSEVSKYIRENAEEIEDNPEANIFIQNNYGYIATTKMDEFVKENKELGFKRVEVLKNLKIMGALKSGKNRPYDMQVSIKGQKKRVYKILLTEETTIPETEIDETI